MRIHCVITTSAEVFVLTRLGENIAEPHPQRLGYDTISFLSSVFVVILTAFCGYGLARLFFPSGVLLTSTDPYAGCMLPIEYIFRSGELCRPVLLETAVVWISAYVDFEKPLLFAFFSLRGLSVGVSMYTAFLSFERSGFLFFPLSYMAVTAVFLIFTRCLRQDVGRVPLSQSVVYALIAGGVASAITLVSALFLV